MMRATLVECKYGKNADEPLVVSLSRGGNSTEIWEETGQVALHVRDFRAVFDA